MAHHRAKRSVMSVVLLSVMIVAVITAGWVWWFQPFQPTGDGTPPYPDPSVTQVTTQATPTPSPSSTTVTSRPTKTTTAPPARTCKQGTPTRLIWRSSGINIDAPIVKIGLDVDGNLGSPSPADKKKIGFYAGGPMPGSGVGNVLIDGHTYRDNSAVFKENFSEKIAKGAVLSFVMDNGSTCSYRVTKVWRGISKQGNAYANLVKSEKFYDFKGPEQVFGVTCSGSWNAFAHSHTAVAAFMATPIN